MHPAVQAIAAGRKGLGRERAAMARYEHLPIFRTALAFNVYLDQCVRGFGRYHKYGIGTQLRQTALNIVRLIIRANNQSDRRETLEDLRLTIEEAKTLCAMAKELRAFASFKSFAHASELVVDLARQNEGWIKQQKSAEPKSGSRARRDVE